MPRLLAATLLVALLAGCDAASDSAETPTPPPEAAFSFDAAFPAQNGRAAAGAHFFAAAGRYAVVSVVVGANLVVPAAVTHAATRAEPVVEDGVWVWETTTAVDGADVTFRLEGAPDGREVDWRLRITSVEGGTLAEDFDLYTATTTLDGSEGSWTLQYPVEGVPTPVLTADFAVRAEADREVTFRVPAGRERAGSSVRYRVDGDARVFEWLALPEDVRTYVEWDETTRTGFIEADDYNGGARACWDADLDDVACEGV